MTSSPEHYITVSLNDGFSVVHVRAQPGERLFDVLRRGGKPVHAPCGGKGTCKKCLVTIDGIGEALACQFVVQHDVLVHVPISHRFAIMEAQNLHARQFVKNPPSEGFGLAIDIGTTTVVLFLEELSTFQVIDVLSFINPQTTYGGDVISRIAFCIEQPNGLVTLQHILSEAINQTTESLCRKNHISPQRIDSMTVVGNTVMLHLFCRVDPRSIAYAPYTPVFVDEQRKRARQLNLDVSPDALVTILPSIAGYVGADILAGVATTDLLDRDGFTLYIDIGTNGEIVLGNKDRIYCCATAAGPAFEGATIECGIGAVEGAISEYIEGEITTIGAAAPVGICGSGLIDIVAELLNKKLIDAGGRMENEFTIVKQKECAVNHDIVLTPKDIREVQLAKAAIYAGIRTLLKHADVSIDQIERLYLAGGFGSTIRTSSAIRIGLLPQELSNRIFPIGNSAATGARLALESHAFRAEIDKVRATADYIELSMRPDFNAFYISAMGFE
ncbi:DUF4445 domain-containing protein [candidate division KSB1 bacterium]|nr:DUF4445 domain-containing protein [candidate division KSB1 bacterium]RQW06912.1 MAG: DUF4445 domain-containing protein [candidate division KSB1 bacterium]